MARTSITSGNFTLNSTVPLPGDRAQRSASDAFHIAIIGDFSGRGSRGELDTQQLGNRKVIEVDRDNFEEVFSLLNVCLRIPLCEKDVVFSDFDSLHPDYLLEHVDVFSKFTTLKNRLKKPEQFDAIVAEMQALKLYNPEQAVTTTDNSTKDTLVTTDSDRSYSLDSILAGAQAQQNNSGDINQYIKQIVAPYAQARTDARLPEMLNAVNEAIAQTLRELMHNSAFQELEANWRGLDFLTRRLETNPGLKLFIIDATRDELMQDALTHDDVDQSALYKRIVSGYQVPGKTPFSCLQANFGLTTELADLHLAFNLAHIAATTGAVALMAGSESLAGCTSLAEQPDAEDWQQPLTAEFSSAWNAFRESELSRSLAVVAPRFLLRLPYGKKTSPIDSFDFSELPVSATHNYYLWGNSSHLITLILASSFQKFGANFDTKISSEIDDLPIHTYQENMESCITPCAEILITDSAVKQLEAAGLLVVRSIANKAAVRVPSLRTAHQSGHIIFS